jgi:hypothetical protein
MEKLGRKSLKSWQHFDREVFLFNSIRQQLGIHKLTPAVQGTQLHFILFKQT